jgi:hypothetical protein
VTRYQATDRPMGRVPAAHGPDQVFVAIVLVPSVIRK